jgi:FkbM family methyltransferase
MATHAVERPKAAGRLSRLRAQLAFLKQRLLTVPVAPALPRPYYYLGGNRALTQLFNGLHFFINTDDRMISASILVTGRWEPFVDDVLSQLCAPGMRVLDLGANLGYYTVRLAHIVGPKGHVLALEPNPDLYSFLRDSVFLNGFSGWVRAERLAASDQSGEAELHVDKLNMGGASLHGLGPQYDSYRVTVPTGRVDDLTAGQPGFDLIKIDIEGWEPQAYKGMADTLTRSSHASIVTEVSWGHWRNFGDPETILRDLLGTRNGLFVIHEEGWLERVALDNLAPFVDRLSYALLTHWDDAKAERLGHLLEPRPSQAPASDGR